MISPLLPYPVSGSGTRAFQLCGHLHASHDVTILTYVGPEEVTAVHRAEEVCARLRAVPLKELGELARRALQVALAPNPTPYAVIKMRTRAMQAALDDLAATRHFDLVQIESSRLWHLRLPAGVPVVIDEHNIEYELLQRMREGEDSPTRRIFNGVEARKFKRLERRAWLAAAGVAVTSNREQTIVHDHARETPTAVVPNAVDSEFFRPSSAPPEPDTVVFGGLLSYRPNLDAARYLVEEIMPLVRRSHPDVKLKIIGGFGQEADVASLRRPGVEVVGWVNDVRPHIQAGAVVVAPLRMGAGTRLKVLEALAMGKAMVSTNVGCEGIHVCDGTHLLIADEPQHFADQIGRLLLDPELAGRLGAAGRQFVQQNYSWQGAGASLDDLHRRVLQGN